MARASPLPMAGASCGRRIPSRFSSCVSRQRPRRTCRNTARKWRAGSRRTAFPSRRSTEPDNPVLMAARPARWIRLAVAAVLVALLVGRWLADHTAERLWAQSLGVGEAHASIAGVRLMLLA